MSATKVQANWSSVAFGSTTITQVSAVSIDQGGSVSLLAADASIYNTVGVTLSKHPKISVTTYDEGTAYGLSGSGLFTATHNDAYLATGGACVYAVATPLAILETVSAGGSHAAFGSSQISIATLSTDGLTAPIGLTRS
jgi:hypothetical protein